VFIAEILPKLDLLSTLSPTQVDKPCMDAVWIVGGVRSLVTKIEAHVKKHVRPWPMSDPMYLAVYHRNAPAARALLESGIDTNKTLDAYTAVHQYPVITR
jgi:hypothetical protein